MAIRKTAEDSFEIPGQRDALLRTCQAALESSGFTSVRSSGTLYVIDGSFHKLSVWGAISIALFPAGENTRVVAKATANVDNIFALFRSPTKTILDAFKVGMSQNLA